jgi:hypothetical protein
MKKINIIEMKKKLVEYKSMLEIITVSSDEFIVENLKHYNDEILNDLLISTIPVNSCIVKYCYYKNNFNILEIEEILDTYFDIVKSLYIKTTDKLLMYTLILENVNEIELSNADEEVENYEVCKRANDVKNIISVKRNNFMLIGK